MKPEWVIAGALLAQSVLMLAFYAHWRRLDRESYDDINQATYRNVTRIMAEWAALVIKDWRQFEKEKKGGEG